MAKKVIQKTPEERRFELSSRLRDLEDERHRVRNLAESQKRQSDSTADRLQLLEQQIVDASKELASLQPTPSTE